MKDKNKYQIKVIVKEIYLVEVEASTPEEADELAQNIICDSDDEQTKFTHHIDSQVETHVHSRQ